MSKTWYAQTVAWASISKAKRKKRAERRAAHGPYAPRGRTHPDNVAARRMGDNYFILGEESSDMPKTPEIPASTPRASEAPTKKAEK